MTEMKDLYSGLGHIAVNTADIRLSLAFYEKLGGRLLMEDVLMKSEGPLKLALVDLGGVTIELLEPPVPFLPAEGSIPHFASLVKNLDEAAAAIRSAGVDTFRGSEKSVNTRLFGGLENWFFTGPSGELIELLQMYG